MFGGEGWSLAQDVVRFARRRYLDVGLEFGRVGRFSNRGQASKLWSGVRASGRSSSPWDEPGKKTTKETK